MKLYYNFMINEPFAGNFQLRSSIFQTIKLKHNLPLLNF